MSSITNYSLKSITFHIHATSDHITLSDHEVMTSIIVNCMDNEKLLNCLTNCLKLVNQSSLKETVTGLNY